MSDTLNFMENINKNNNPVNKPTKILTESEDNWVTNVYMNTWGNYNENGADVDKIDGGWKTPQEALDWCKEHSNEECFINDYQTNLGVDLDINEYSNTIETLEALIELESLDEYDVKKVGAIIDGWGDDLVEAIEMIKDHGDEIYLYEDVNNDKELGYYYVDNIIGSISGLGKETLANYFDYDAFQEMLEINWDNSGEYDEIREEYPDLEETDPDEFERLVEERTQDSIESYIDEIEYGGPEGYISENDMEYYFDYERFGRDLSFNGTFTKYGFLEDY